VLPVTSEQEAVQREAVVAAALRFVRTPYRQLGDRVGVGVDCAMLLVRAWVDGGVFEPFDPRPYPPEWHLHKSEERYLGWLQTLAIEVQVPQRGDIAVYRFGRCFSHGAIVLGDGYLVHAFAPSRVCRRVEAHDAALAGRPVRYFDVWGRLRQMEV